MEDCGTVHVQRYGIEAVLWPKVGSSAVSRALRPWCFPVLSAFTDFTRSDEAAEYCAEGIARVANAAGGVVEARSVTNVTEAIRREILAEDTGCICRSSWC